MLFLLDHIHKATQDFVLAKEAITKGLEISNSNKEADFNNSHETAGVLELLSSISCHLKRRLY